MERVGGVGGEMEDGEGEGGDGDEERGVRPFGGFGPE